MRVLCIAAAALTAAAGVGDARNASVSAAICTETPLGPCTCLLPSSCDSFIFKGNVDVTCAGESSCINTTFAPFSSVECAGGGSCSGANVCTPGEYVNTTGGCLPCPDDTVPLTPHRGRGAASRRCAVDDSLPDAATKYVSDDGTVKECVPRTSCRSEIVGNVCNECIECEEGAFMYSKGYCVECPELTTTPSRPGVGTFHTRCTLCKYGSFGFPHQCMPCPEFANWALGPGVGHFNERCFRSSGGLSVGQLWAIIDGFIFVVCVFVLLGLRHWYYLPNRRDNVEVPLQGQSPENEYETVDMSAVGEQITPLEGLVAPLSYLTTEYEEANYDSVLQDRDDGEAASRETQPAGQ